MTYPSVHIKDPLLLIEKSGSLLYVRCNIALNKMFWVCHEIKHFLPSVSNLRRFPTEFAMPLLTAQVGVAGRLWWKTCHYLCFQQVMRPGTRHWLKRACFMWQAAYWFLPLLSSWQQNHQWPRTSECRLWNCSGYEWSNFKCFIDGLGLLWDGWGRGVEMWGRHG